MPQLFLYLQVGFRGDSRGKWHGGRVIYGTWIDLLYGHTKGYELAKEQWERVKAILPPERTGQRGRLRKDDRNMLNGMLWIAHSGAQWRELPEAYGPWQSVYARFAKWQDDGTLKPCFEHCPQMRIWKT